MQSFKLVMSTCNTCARPFGFFNKELGCPRCKRVFCKKCLGHKIRVSTDLKKMIYVCLKCSKVPNTNSSNAKKKGQEEIENILK